tara:strand:+ start:339 stop:689 length:351 start_codon:yes stop_codon:yes gene_type:complete
MATITSHTLNGSNGTHADGITVILKNLSENREVFQTKMDIGGRLNKIVDPEEINENSTYELIFLIGEYWKNFYNDADKNVVDEIVVRFKMPDKNKKYHFPIILSQNSYSTWWSQGE